MRIHRVYTRDDLEPGLETTLGEQAAHYLLRVLRVAAGQSVVLFNGDGHDYYAEVVRAGKRTVSLSVLSRLPAVTESGLNITVVQAVSRGERMDQTLQKCTELGAAAFQPLFTKRVEIRLNENKLEKRLSHWQGVVNSACEQCGRAVVPRVARPSDLGEWLARKSDRQRLALVPGAGSPLARVKFTGPVDILIGPEGGFTDPELDEMRAHDVQPVSLGPRVLRTETAAPAAVAVMQTLAGDFAY